MIAASAPARALAAALAGATMAAGCGARSDPPSHPGGTMQASHPPDDDSVPATPATIELTLVADAAIVGRVSLRIAQHGHDDVTVILPDRADQVEWFAPDERGLAEPTLRVKWSAWRIDNGGGIARARSIAATITKRVTLAPGDVRKTEVDLARAIDGLLLPEGATLGWCARAWLVGGVHPVPSNIVCWPEPA